MTDTTDTGYIQKVWVPYPYDSDVYIFVTAQKLEWMEDLPPTTEYTPDYYTWFHVQELKNPPGIPQPDPLEVVG